MSLLSLVPWDFTCLVGAALSLYLLKYWILRRSCRAAYGAADFLFIAGSCLAAWLWLDHATVNERQRLQQMVQALAPTYAREMEQMGHEKIGLNTAANDPLYLRLINAEKRWLQMNPHVMDIYTLRKLPDGKNVFIVDSETDYDHNNKYEGEREQRTAIGEVYPEPDEGLERAFAGESNFDFVPITDRWGTWVSAWEPLHGSDGRVESVLGVDYAAEEWNREIGYVRFQVLAAIGLAQIVFGSLTGGLALQGSHRRKQQTALDALRQSEARLTLHLDQTPLAVIEWDRGFRVRRWNPSAERIFGYSSEEAIGRTGFESLVHESMREAMKQTWADIVENRRPQSNTLECLTKSGAAIWCECVNTPLVNSEGGVIGAASFCRDITERRVFEEKLHQSQKMQCIGQLAAGVAHDFNNLLCIIQGYSDVIVDTPGLPPAARDAVVEIDQAAGRAANITRQLLTFARKEAASLSVLAVSDVLERTLQMLKPALGPDVEVRINNENSVPRIWANRTMLEQALLNLAFNARDAMPQGGVIELATASVQVTKEQAALNVDAKMGRFVRLSVRDQGCGITPEHMEHIFEPFFTTKAVGQGTGLGLATVYGIVKQHGGWVEVSSDLGKGTTFALYFPICETPDFSGGHDLNPARSRLR